MKSEFLLKAARELSENLSEDISKCATREEHVRVTSRANAAVALYNAMSSEYGDLSMELEEDV